MLRKDSSAISVPLGAIRNITFICFHYILFFVHTGPIADVFLGEWPNAVFTAV